MKKFIPVLFLIIIIVVTVFILKQNKKINKAKALPRFNITFDKALLHSSLYAPTDIHEGKITPSTAGFSWNFALKNNVVPTGMAREYAILSGFRIYRDGNWFTDVPKTQTNFTDNGLFPGQSYSYAVSALTFDNKIEGKKSASVNLTIPPGKPNPIVFPVKNITRYLAEGDSITEGSKVGKIYAYVTLFGNYLAQKNPDVKVFNKGISNSYSSGVAKRIEKEIGDLRPDLVTVAIGINDMIAAVPGVDTGNVSLREYRDNLRTIIQKSQPARRSVALLNIYYLNCCPERRKAWNAVVRDVANESGILLIDVSSALEPGGVQNLDGGIHPNGEGNSIIANTIIDRLKPYLDIK